MNKKITMKLYSFECINGLHGMGNKGTSSIFESGEKRFAYRIDDKEDLGFGDGYFITLVKEPNESPVWFKDNGEITDVPLNEGGLGIISYGYIGRDANILITNNSGAFQKLLEHFSDIDDKIILTPLFENNAADIALNWDYYKKLAISFNFPTDDDVSEFMSIKEGRQFKFVDEFGGLKFDTSIEAPKQKQVLNTAQVKEIIKVFMNNEYCTKLIVKGAEFENVTQTIDIKNAHVTHSENLELSSNIIYPGEIMEVIRQACSKKFIQYIK